MKQATYKKIRTDVARLEEIPNIGVSIAGNLRFHLAACGKTSCRLCRRCRGESRASVIRLLSRFLASSSARLHCGRAFDLFYPATLARRLHRHHSLAVLRGDTTTMLASRAGQSTD